MSNEVQVAQPTGRTLYFVVLDGQGRAYDGASFESPLAANWGDYAFALAEADATGIYRGTFPAVAAGSYGITAYRQLGGSPAPTDTVAGEGRMEWDGDSEIGLADLASDPYSKARQYGDVQVESDGSLTYYDADDADTPRLRFARRGSPGGRTVTKDPA